MTIDSCSPFVSAIDFLLVTGANCFVIDLCSALVWLVGLEMDHFIDDMSVVRILAVLKLYS